MDTPTQDFFNFSIYNPLETKPLSVEGENRRAVGVLIVGELTEAHRGLLGKILAAVKLDWADIALVRCGAEGATLAPLQRQIPCKVWVVFGGNPARKLGWTFPAPLYRRFDWNGTGYLLSDPLAAIEADKEKKMRLWQALQACFSV